MAPLGVRDLVPQDSRQMILGVEIVNQPRVDVDESPGGAERIEDVIIVDDSNVVVGEEIPILDLLRANYFADDAI